MAGPESFNCMKLSLAFKYLARTAGKNQISLSDVNLLWVSSRIYWANTRRVRSVRVTSSLKLTGGFRFDRFKTVSEPTENFAIDPRLTAQQIEQLGLTGLP